MDSDELNFQNPTSLTGELTIQQPNMLMATLKEYQLKGLNWLATLYEQGIKRYPRRRDGLGQGKGIARIVAHAAHAYLRPCNQFHYLHILQRPTTSGDRS